MRCQKVWGLMIHLFKAMAYTARTMVSILCRPRQSCTSFGSGWISRIIAHVACGFFLWMGLAQPAHAYENEHYVWTYYLALQVGFTERQAYQIASSTIAIDFDSDTGPMPIGGRDKLNTALGNADEARFRRRWREFHAFMDMDQFHLAQDEGRDPYNNQERFREISQNKLWAHALRQKSPGGFLHFVQDREPHGGWGDYLGHGTAGHIPDYFATDRTKAWKMTEDTLGYLVKFKTHICRGKSPREHLYCRTKNVDKTRISSVLDSMIASTKIPAPARQATDIKALLKKLKSNSLTLRHHWFPFSQSSLLSENIREMILEYELAGIPYGAVRNLVVDGAPDQILFGYISVIRKAVREDKRSGLLDFVPTNLPDRDRILELVDRNLETDLPDNWIAYDYDSNAAHASTIPASVYELEDQKFETGLQDIDKPSYRKISGEGDDAMIEVSLEFPVKLSRSSDFNSFIKSPSSVGQQHSSFRPGNFLETLPVAVISYAPGAPWRLEPQSKKVLFVSDVNGNGQTANRGASFQANNTVDHEVLIEDGRKMRLAVIRKLGDLKLGRLRWEITLAAYGFPTSKRNFQLQYDGEDLASTDACPAVGESESTISLASSSCAPEVETDSESNRLLRALADMRALEAQGQILRQNALAAASAADDSLGQLQANLAAAEAELEIASAGSADQPSEQASAADEISVLERQAFAIAGKMANLRRTIEARTLQVCEAYERISAATDVQSVESIYTGFNSAHATVNGLDGEYRTLRDQLEQLKAEAMRLHGASGKDSSRNPAGTQAALSARLKAVERRLAVATSNQDSLRRIAAQFSAVVAQANTILSLVGSVEDAGLDAADQSIVTEIYSIFDRILAGESATQFDANRIEQAVAGQSASIDLLQQRVAQLQQAGNDTARSVASRAEQSRNDVALNSFNASYETALLYSDPITIAARSSKTCYDAALAIYRHRQNLEQLANDRTPDPEPTQQKPEKTEQALAVERSESEPAPSVDPCTSEKVQSLFARADRALAKEKIDAWSSAARKIASRGCQNSRLNASIAAANALIDRKNRESEMAARIDAVEGRLPKPEKKPGRGLGNLLGTIGNVIGVVNAARGKPSIGNSGNAGGVLGSILQQSSSSGQTAPASPRPQSDAGGMGALGSGGVVQDPVRAGVLAGSIGRQNGNSNNCSTLQSQINAVAAHMNRAAAARNIPKLKELTAERDRLFAKTCTAKCGYPLSAYCVGRIK